MSSKPRTRKGTKRKGAPGTTDGYFKSWMISVIDKVVFGGRADISSRGADGLISITTYKTPVPYYAQVGTVVPFTGVVYHTDEKGEQENSTITFMQFTVPSKWHNTSPRLVNAHPEKTFKTRTYPAVTVELRPVNDTEADGLRLRYDQEWKSVDWPMPEDKRPSHEAVKERFVRILSFSMLVPPSMLVYSLPPPPAAAAEQKKEEGAEKEEVEEPQAKKARKSEPARDGKDESAIAVDKDGDPMGHGGWKCAN